MEFLMSENVFNCKSFSFSNEIFSILERLKDEPWSENVSSCKTFKVLNESEVTSIIKKVKLELFFRAGKKKGGVWVENGKKIILLFYFIVMV